MIKFSDSLDELKKEIAELDIGIEIDEIVKIDLPFIESQSNFTIINIPSYGHENSSNLIFTKKDQVLICTSTKQIKIEKKFEKIMKKKQGESTITIFILLKSILKNYSQEFLKIRDMMNTLDFDPVLDSIEDAGRQLRKLTDRLEGLFQIGIELKEEEIDCFHTKLIDFEYELFNTESRYWLERCRSHNYRIASLRTKSEMKSNRELNDTMKKLTVIMTFLTIVSIVVNVPGTVGAIFGIPALSNAYFESHTTFLILTLITTTILSMLLGFLYWKFLNLKQR
ncbi:MAG: hypothetical protein Q7R33_09995 [Nitrosarchaeum sp.]|nr:hypothetical protein [Nitrosarchaeum sp.]